MTTEEMLIQLREGQKQMSKDISDLKSDMAIVKSDIAELKEETKITRSATNTLIEKFEDFLEVYNAQHEPEFKLT